MKDKPIRVEPVSFRIRATIIRLIMSSPFYILAVMSFVAGIKANSLLSLISFSMLSLAFTIPFGIMFLWSFYPCPVFYEDRVVLSPIQTVHYRHIESWRHNDFFLWEIVQVYTLSHGGFTVTDGWFPFQSTSTDPEACLDIIIERSSPMVPMD